MIDVTLQFEDDEITDALRLHLSRGVKVQTYIRAAMIYFADARKNELMGKAVGHGDAKRFKDWNVVMSTDAYLNAAE